VKTLRKLEHIFDDDLFNVKNTSDICDILAIAMYNSNPSRKN